MQKTNARKLYAIIIILLLSLLTACAHNPQKIDPTNINDLENMTADSSTVSESSQIGQIRMKALEDTALSIGAQGGLAWASQQINKRTEKDKWYLESIYNFHGVLPPVLTEGNNSLNLADPSTIRIADKTYKIVQQARFATTPPNWREYIWLPFNKPELPNKVLLPRTSEERAVWSKSIRLGWQKGIEQAYSIFQQNLARLKRDYNGMILYRKLLQEKMVSAPYVSKTELGVTGDGSDMRINDQVLRITEMPKLQTDSSNWNAIVVKEYDN
jgi:defect-in-organelle-trafficking protein DotC